MDHHAAVQQKSCAKRRDATRSDGDGDDASPQQRQQHQQQQQLPWPTKRPRNRLPDDGDDADVDDCGSATVEAIKNHCRSRDMPSDAYRPVLRGDGGCGGGGGGKFRLSDLIGELHRVFAEDSVNVEYVQYLMDSYRSDPAEWLKYAKFNKYRYTRNLVDAGNGKFNLMVLCWGEGDGSSIHNHPQADCVMKILAGELTEVRFAWPENPRADAEGDDNGDGGGDDDQHPRPMCEIGRSVLKTNVVLHINDSMGLHRVENASHTDKAVSLHLYCPPFEECSTFNQQTGHETKTKSTFWSINGKKVSKKRVEQYTSDDN